MSRASIVNFERECGVSVVQDCEAGVSVGEFAVSGLQMFINVGVFIRGDGFTNVARVTSCSNKLVNHKGFEITGNWVFETGQIFDFI